MHSLFPQSPDAAAEGRRDYLHVFVFLQLRGQSARPREILLDLPIAPAVYSALPLVLFELCLRAPMGEVPLTVTACPLLASRFLSASLVVWCQKCSWRSV